MRKHKPLLNVVIHFLAHAGLVGAYVHHDPVHAALYGLLLFGDLLELLTSRSSG